MDMEVRRRYISDIEAAARYGLSVSKLRSDRFLGKGLPYAKFGRKCLYDVEECDAVMESKKIRPEN